MKRIFLLLSLICMLLGPAYAQNHMELMTTIYGEFDGDEFGARIVAMDYNNDGYDDLIVVATYWNDTGVLNTEYYPGKLYFYWGGPDGLDSSPGFVIEGQLHRQYAPFMCNAGDMNGDGIDDLAITYTTDIPWGTYKSIAIFLGRPDPQPEPDYIMNIPYTFVAPRFLGDINGDGKSDLAINGEMHIRPYLPFTYIWTDLDSDPILFRDSSIDGVMYLGGVGDVNNDGFDDAYLTQPINPSSQSDQRAALFFGNASVTVSDSLLIKESIFDPYSSAFPLGDINGDGFADFIGYREWPFHYVWLVSTELDSIPDLILSNNSPDHDMSSFGRFQSDYAVYGDINGDGYDDFVCSDPWANSYNGQAGLWLGGPNVNATVDLVFNPFPDWRWRNFGHAKAIGDFNGDGYDDLALSCHRWRNGAFHDPGRLYVFAGNAQLQDTTVSNDDPVAPPNTFYDWRMNVYPNPYPSGSGMINVQLLGDSFTKTGNYSYKLFNVRGQKICEGNLKPEEFGSRCFRLDLYGLSAGIYQLTVLLDGNVKNTKRMVVY